MVSTDYKRIFLRVLWEQATGEDAQALLDALLVSATARINATSTGVTLIATSGNNKTVQFEMPAAGRGCSPQDIAILLSQLIDLAELSRSYLNTNLGSDPNGDQLVTEMLARLEPVRETHSDLSGWVRSPHFS